MQLGGGGKSKDNGLGQQPGGAANQTANGGKANGGKANGGLSIGGLQLGGNKPPGGTGNSALDAFLNQANQGKKNGTANAGQGAGAATGGAEGAGRGGKGAGGPGANPGEAAKAEQGLGSSPGEAAKANEAAKEAQRKDKGSGAGVEVAKPAGEAARPAGEGNAEAGQPKAVQESEQFKDNAGITVGADGQVQNGNHTFIASELPKTNIGVVPVGGDLGITKGSDGGTSVGGKSGKLMSSAGFLP